MKTATAERAADTRCSPAQRAMLADVMAGLRRRPRRLSPKYFYDRRGSQLFEQICQQPEYYLTRAELALMRDHAGSIAQAVGPRVQLVEYGSGSGVKTQLLLRHLAAPAAYVPVEISASALAASVRRLKADFPHIHMRPVHADFTAPLHLPPLRPHTRRRVIYFPGSTIGNFDARAATALLRQMRRQMGDTGAALVGADRVKDAQTITAAYNDAAGVTARFTLNMLARFNRELGANFDLRAYRHRARYNAIAERVETAIISTQEQVVHLGSESFFFAPGDAIEVEISCKYSRASFAQLAAAAGLVVAREWHDANALFSVFLLEPELGRAG